MAVTITVRNVPEHVRDELKARAERRGQSMQEFLRLELERIASKPSSEESTRQIRERTEGTGTHTFSSVIVDIIREDRGPLPPYS